MAEVTEPGVYDMPAETYHADPVAGGSLSSSGARRLLPPSCPAIYRYECDHPAAPTGSMELGTAAHMVVLGEGPPIHVVDARDYKGRDAQDERDAARAAGQIPLLPRQNWKVQQMADALRRHRKAAALLQPGSGRAEQSVFWFDQHWGVWRRARLDWLPHGAGGQVIIPDYKTTGESVHRDTVSRKIASLGYHCQGDWYAEAVRALRPGISVRFALIIQMTDPPFLVGTYYLDADAMWAGSVRNAEALEVYRDCQQSGVWPGHSPAEDLEPIGLPGWAMPREW